ncbi:MAG: hypothetical protein ACP5GF_02505 [Thiomonas sp.]
MTLRDTTRLLCALAVSACMTRAPAFAAQQPTPEQDAAQQLALQAQRAQVQARHQAEQAACMHRFFVNDCLDASRQQERKALAPIDADLQAIALRARMRAAEAELRQVQANIAAAQAGQPDSALAERQSAARAAALAQREKQAAERARQAAADAAQGAVPPSLRPKTAPPAPRLFAAPAPQAALTPAQRAAQADQAQADYAAKQKAYADKQAAQARQSAAQKQAAPLPVPSPSAPLH